MRLVLPPEPAGADPRYVRLRDGATARELTALVEICSPEERALDLARLTAILLAPSAHWIERTPYVGIVRVPPGVGASLDAGLLHVRAYVPEHAQYPSALASGRPDPRAIAGKLLALLREATRRAMAGARHVAVMAGGGVDSSVLLALALEEGRAQNVQVTAVALDFASPGDDRPHLAALAAHLDITPIRVSPRDAAPFVLSSLVLDAAPCTWPSAPLERALAEAAKRVGADRILSGAGGDDLFDGDPAALARLLFSRPLEALRRTRAIELPWKVSRLGRVRDLLVRPLLSPLVPVAARRLRRARQHKALYPWAGPRLQASLDAIAHATRTPPMDRGEVFATSPQLAEVGTMRAQFERGAGLRRVDPFLDPALMSFVSSIDPMTLLVGEDNDRLRGLFRESARGLVPESVRLRNDKAGFEPAQHAMVEAAGGFDVLRPLAAVPRAAALGLAMPEAFRSAFEALAREPLSGDWLGVWPLLAVEAFLRTLEVDLEGSWSA